MINPIISQISYSQDIKRENKNTKSQKILQVQKGLEEGFAFRKNKKLSVCEIRNHYFPNISFKGKKNKKLEEEYLKKATDSDKSLEEKYDARSWILEEKNVSWVFLSNYLDLEDELFEKAYKLLDSGVDGDFKL